MGNLSIFVVSDKPDALAELCSGAKQLGRVTAVVFGDESAAKDAAACGADAIRFCPLGDMTAPEDYAVAIAALVKQDPRALVMLNNSIRGRCLAGKLGVLLDTAVLTTVNELVVEGDTPVCRRMVYGGTAQRQESFEKPYAVVTVGNGVFELAGESAVCADIAQIEGEPQGTLTRVAFHEKRESVVNLAAAKRIVDVGRGWKAEEDLALCRELAQVLEAEVGCSRPVAENNKWMPKSCYMGVTGVQVKPDLCMSLAVSGQVQHIAGINKSKVIVAVNKDKEAPIFKNADFGLVGDVYKVVPALIAALS